MNEEEFLTTVEHMTRSGREQAREAVQATLETLGERIAGGEARDIAEQLPAGVAPYIASEGKAEPFDVDTFLGRVARREEVDADTAKEHARAVLEALRRAITDKEFSDMVAQLPKEYAPLLPRGPDIEAVGADNFLQQVADRAGTHRDVAERATKAVLETLAERIAGGEVDDLIARLPNEFHAPLRRGRENSGGKAQRMSFDEFIEVVAERERVDPDVAREHTAAVLSALRDAVGEEEFRDITAQLPKEYLRELI